MSACYSFDLVRTALQQKRVREHPLLGPHATKAAADSRVHSPRAEVRQGPIRNGADVHGRVAETNKERGSKGYV